MTGETYIRIVGSESLGWLDLYTEYGISLDETAVSKLMTPAPNKQPTENTSDIMNGKRLVRDVGNVCKEERNVQLSINIYGSTKSEFLNRYGRFCDEVLDKGYFDLKSVHNPNTIYRLSFVDCQQFSEYNMTLGKFSLTVNEPDPTNRGVNDKWEQELEEL